METFNESVLIFSLIAIREECRKHKDCDYCPLYDYDYRGCGLREKYPEDWKLKHDEEIAIDGVFQ